jgi:integrative and conjugative element protein (TIGR02256 family)
MCDGHRLALEQLDELVAASRGSISMPLEPRVNGPDGPLVAQLSLDCAGTATAAGGINLRKRERFTILVPREFPFDKPLVYVPHRRWAGTPHVQWGSHLCLYAAPSIEWAPADSMFGLIDRLSLWLERAAMGELDPDDQPLHPPVAYVGAANGVVVVRADIGDLAPPPSQNPRPQPGTGQDSRTEAAGAQRIVVGIAEAEHAGRYDLVEWVSQADWLQRFADGQLVASPNGRRLVGMVAVLTDREMSFEYPKFAAQLVTGLHDLGVTRTELFTAIGVVAAVNDLLAGSGGAAAPAELHLLVGTPSRRVDGGTLRQHLVCWRFDELGRLIAENIAYAGADEDALARLGELANEFLPRWIDTAPMSWVRVLEDRAEITIRRDVNSSADWVRGRRATVLGCGALGAPIAEFCVRAGAASVFVVDNDIVTPGILVRQPYADDEIGEHKASALAARLNQIRQDDPVVPLVGSIEDIVLGEHASPPQVDLVIDATADATVAALLELRRSTARHEWPPLLTVMIGHDARRGIGLVAKSGATGAGRDIARKLALAGRQQHAHRLRDVVADFFPAEPRTAMFQPEPGCSSPTFTGSSADLSALAGHLLDAGLRAIAGVGPPHAGQPMVAAVVRLDGPSAASAQPGVDWFGWPDDTLHTDPHSGYEIRVSRPALARMGAEVRHGARLRGPRIETGGLLLGQIDDACRCIWIDDVSGPPPDSLLSAVHFDHGVEGVADLIDYHRTRSGKLTSYLGMWHSHPNNRAAPSLTDTAAMSALVSPVADAPRRAVIVIVGGDQHTWAAWIDGTRDPDIFGRLVNRARHGQPIEPPPAPPEHRAIAWPGGWTSRPAGTAPRAPRRLRRFRLRRRQR